MVTRGGDEDVTSPASIQSKVYPDGTWVTFSMAFTEFPSIVYVGDLHIGDIPYMTYGVNRTDYHQVDGGYVAAYRGQIYSW